MTFPITGIYGALLGLLVVALSLNVIRLRIREKVSLGDGGKISLNRAIRAHGNAIENIPLGIVLLGLLEADGGTALALHAYGATLVIGRVLHAIGLAQKSSANRTRQLGVLLTLMVLLGLACSLLVKTF